MKVRLDLLLVQKGFFHSRERAKAAVMEGLVFVDGRISDKPGTPTDTEASVTVKNDVCPYVSRGGLKLEKAIHDFGVDLTGKSCIDIGASTGGFTDCMLQNGASTVYAVDVGYGQLAWKLREDERVVNIEKCNFRYFDSSVLKSPPDFASIDVSFISLSMIFPVLKDIISPDGEVVCLVKPQFEAGREQVGKKGIVREPSVQIEVIKKVIASSEKHGFSPAGLSYSPITGAKGNIEFLLYLNKAKKIGYNITDSYINNVVLCSHKELL